MLLLPLMSFPASSCNILIRKFSEPKRRTYFLLLGWRNPFLALYFLILTHSDTTKEIKLGVKCLRTESVTEIGLAWFWFRFIFPYYWFLQFRMIFVDQNKYSPRSNKRQEQEIRPIRSLPFTWQKGTFNTNWPISSHCLNVLQQDPNFILLVSILSARSMRALIHLAFYHRHYHYGLFSSNSSIDASVNVYLSSTRL